MSRSNLDHQAILEALRDHDGARASRLMETHVLRAKKRVLAEAFEQDTSA